MREKAFGTHDIARICHVTPPNRGDSSLRLVQMEAVSSTQGHFREV